jgi:hypothetical protein
VVTSSNVLPALRPYQREIARAVLDSVFNRRGETFSVEIARQGGKNELSAQLEMLLLTLAMGGARNLVKCAPTFNPQCLLSMRRLADRLDDAGFAGAWYTEAGHIVRLGHARAVFLSAEPGARVVGNTAHLLLEIDESQDVNREKYTKEFRPMAAAENATVVHYGTTWDESTLLEEVKQVNLDGVRRHFRFDWEAVADCNPPYRAFVEAERRRLGEDHPLFRTQYRLLTVREGGGLFTPEQLALLRGTHARQRYRDIRSTYVAGLDVAGEAPDGPGGTKDRDSTVLTIARLDFPPLDDPVAEPVVRVVEHYAWTGRPHDELHRVLVQYLRDVWNVRRVCVDATGMGEPVASYLRKALGSRVVPVKFTARTKSGFGFRLLAAVNGGRLKIYRGDSSVAWMLCLDQLEKARVTYRPNRTMTFDVDPARGHDDYLMSLVLCLEAASRYEKRTARGVY